MAFIKSIFTKADPVELNIPTYDGSGQAVHPSVIFFPNGWNGYKYWMAFTPYPGQNPAYENPSIITSNDSISWEVPSGLTNPLVPAPPTGFNADPELVYDFVDNKLRLYYITNEIVKFIESYDGINWSNPTYCKFFPSSVSLMAPTIQRKENAWTMWVTVATSGPRGYWIYQYNSSDGITWTQGPPIILNNVRNDIVPWHSSIYFDGNIYHFLVACYTVDSDNGHTRLWYGRSEDGISFLLDTSPLTKIGQIGQFYSREIYRSCLTQTLSGQYRIIISAANSTAIWRLGYIDVDITNISPYNKGMDITPEVTWQGSLSASSQQTILDIQRSIIIKKIQIGSSDPTNVQLQILRYDLNLSPNQLMNPEANGSGFYSTINSSSSNYWKEFQNYLSDSTNSLYIFGLRDNQELKCPYGAVIIASNAGTVSINVAISVSYELLDI